jgi:hypothetical protein
MVFMGDGGSKQCHEAITQKLIDRPFIPMYLAESEFEEPV